jgi:hypothetical protein
MKKKSISKILGAICIVAIFAGCVEYTDGGPGLWNYVCLGLSALCGWGSKKLEITKSN